MRSKKQKKRYGWDEDQTFVNILTNSGFKAFFGDEKNKEEVMEVLNALLPVNCQVEAEICLEKRKTRIKSEYLVIRKNFSRPTSLI